MKKWVVVAVMVLFCVNNIYAQKYDYHWIIGADIGGSFHNNEIFFTDISADTIRSQRRVDMDNAQTTISDSAGNLLFYTNAAKVYTAHDSIMVNGDSINYGTMWYIWGGAYYAALQGIMGLPSDQPDVWNLFHYFIDYNTNTDLVEYPWRIYQTQVDMSRNSGKGAIVYKNKTVLEDTIGFYVTACRHANGRDWWMLENKTSTNCLYTFLVQPDTNIKYPNQCIGDVYKSGDGGQALFSPDGSKFAWLGGSYSGLCLYDFDRCTGELTNPTCIPMYRGVSSNPTEFGLSFSPNSRFLYMCQSIYLFQFDTWAADVSGSIDTVGYYIPPPPDGVSLPGYFFLMQLAPDGKIYMSANNSMKYLHVINQPDRLGDSCNFVNYGFPLPYPNTFGIPNYPNYRLGRMVGSACDTLHTDVGIATIEDKQLQVYPNPANDYVVIDYGYNDWSKGEIRLEVSNDIGQIVHLQKLPMYSGFQKLDITAYSNGLYSVCIKRGNTIVYTSKFVKK